MKTRTALAVTALLAVLVSSCNSSDKIPGYVTPSGKDASGKVVSTQRKWLSHRGVDLKCTVAGENSLEAVAYARKVGFESIETDVRTTSDSVLVCMHDPTLNRTCLNLDGTKIENPAPVSEVTLEELKTRYRLKADREEMRTQVPTLEEYLTCCKENGLLVFIEPKLKDETGRHYLDIIEMADRILGRDGYIVTSNNYANGVIRNTLRIKDVKVMTILYQTTYEAIQALGNSVMAISTVRFSKEEFAANMEKAVADGFETESNTDNFPRLDMINKAPVNYISTDLLVPDYKGQGKLVLDLNSRSKWETLNKQGKIGFGALYLEMTYSGEAEVTLGSQTFSVDDSNGLDAGNGNRKICFQLLLYKEKPVADIKPKSSEFNLKSSRLRFVIF